MVDWEYFTDDRLITGTDLIGSGLGGPVDMFEIARNRDRAGKSKPFQVRFSDNGASATYPTFSDIGEEHRIEVPDDATSLRVKLQGKVAAGSGYAQGKLVGTSTLTSAEVSGITNTTYGNPDQNEIVLVWTDVSALRGETVSLKFETSNSAGNATNLESLDRTSAKWGHS